jgi:hypothetical protein
LQRIEIGGVPNPQNVWNISPDQIHYDVADWALAEMYILESLIPFGI